MPSSSKLAERAWVYAGFTSGDDAEKIQRSSHLHLHIRLDPVLLNFQIVLGFNSVVVVWTQFY